MKAAGVSSSIAESTEWNLKRAVRTTNIHCPALWLLSELEFPFESHLHTIARGDKYTIFSVDDKYIYRQHAPEPGPYLPLDANSPLSVWKALTDRICPREILTADDMKDLRKNITVGQFRELEEYFNE